MPTSQSNKRRWAIAVIHCAAVLLLFVVPDLLITYVQPQKPWVFYIEMYARTIGILLIFYVNYLWLVKVTIERRPRKVWLYVGANLLMLALFLLAMYLMMQYMPHQRHPRPEPGPPPEFVHWRQLSKLFPMLSRDFMTVILAIVLSITLRLTELWTHIERKNDEILAAQRTEEIQNLRSQLNPHSIFNSLNTVYALIDIDTEQAKQALHRLSKLLRYELYENPSTVELSKEIDFLRSYVELMEMRLGSGKVVLDINVDGHEQNRIAPLLFLPAVENAFKHAAPVSKEAPIHISIHADGHILTCFTSNSYLPSAEPKTGGIGLENLRRRLQLLYGEEATLQTISQDKRFEVTIKIPLQ